MLIYTIQWRWFLASGSASKLYDVALSFAGEDRDYVEAVANALRSRGVRVFYDKFEEADLIGRNLVDHLSLIYQKQARLCIVFVSAAYAKKPYTRLERQAAQSRFLETEDPYIIPVRLDDTELPGLLPTVAYVSGKTPHALAELIASKLVLLDAPGFKTSSSPRSKAESLVVRFVSAVEPDMAVFRETLRLYEHWAEERLRYLPVELRIPEFLEQQIERAQEFRNSDLWTSARISDAARDQFTEFYGTALTSFLDDTVKGLQILVQCYWFARNNRLEYVVRRFLMTRMTTLCRLLLSVRLVGMAPVEWEPMFANFSSVWNDWVMNGLPYSCFLDGDEGFLWVDADARDTSSNIIWPKSYRVYIPSAFALSGNLREPLNSDLFDRFFAIQLLSEELNGAREQPLQYFSQYPERLKLTVRGEWAIETAHFEQHGTSNSGGRPLFPAVAALRNQALQNRHGVPMTEAEQFVAVHRIQSLFRDGSQFNAILFPEVADA